MTRYLLTNQVIATELWAGLETNPAYSQDITTKATVAKNAAGTYFKYRPGVDVVAVGNFPDIALAKSGWIMLPNSTLSNLQTNDNAIVYSGNITKVGQIYLASNIQIHAVAFYLRRFNSPSGNAVATIRRSSDNVILAQSSNFNVSLLTSSYKWYYFIFTTVPLLNTSIRILFEYSGGDVSNNIYVARQNSNVVEGEYTYASDTDFTTDGNKDATFIIYPLISLNGSFAVGDWTFKVALYNNAKYGHAVKIAARLSRSVNTDGSNATLIGAVTESPNTITLAGAVGDIKTDSWTYNLGAVTLTNEYLFVEYRCVIVTLGSSASTKHDFMVDEDPATRDESITPTTFTPAGGPEWKKLQYFTEPPSVGWNKLKYASEPPIPAAWNKLLYEGE